MGKERMLDEAKVSVERLFAEDFKPAWMVVKERQAKQALDDAVTTDVEFKFREEALEAVRQASRNHPPKQRSNVVERTNTA